MTDEPTPADLADERIEHLDRRLDLLEERAARLVEDNREVRRLLADNGRRLESLQNRFPALS